MESTEQWQSTIMVLHIYGKKKRRKKNLCNLMESLPDLLSQACKMQMYILKIIIRREF